MTEVDQTKLKELFPEMWAIYQTINITNVNPDFIPQIMRGIHNIKIGTGKGRVIIEINDDSLRVQVREYEEEIGIFRV